MQQTENKKSEGRFSSELFGWGESLMAVLVFFVVVFTFFVRLIGVDGMSMYPTLEDHSIMLVSNLNYTPERGDVVVLRKEGFYNNQPIVKRIIATGGDTVDIDPVTGDVSVNGEVLDEPYINRNDRCTRAYGRSDLSADRAGGLRVRHGRQPQRLYRQPRQPSRHGG